MPILEVLTAPHPFLKIKAKPVEAYDDDLKTLIEDMLETMYESSGIGLAATQVGQDKRLIVIDIEHDHETGESSKKPMIIINPKIIDKQGEQIMEEGCLSVPEFRAEVKRYSQITLSYLNENQEQKTLDAEELLAVCIQHELDHLDGILFIDHLPLLKRKMILKKLQKMTAKN
ncbi:MAG: peptide deformylase [Deltaproteobacteria bacterium]|nr:peptide deformylase [Deltaproteobacteria bacterium]